MSVILVCEEQRFEISRKAAQLSTLFNEMLEDDENEISEIPVIEVSVPILEKVVEFLNYHEENPMEEIHKPILTNNLVSIVGQWDSDFIDLDQRTHFMLILAANYLNIPSLLDLGLCKIACMIKDKKPNEVSELFGVDDEISPEEEKTVREANPWIFQLQEQEQ